METNLQNAQIRGKRLRSGDGGSRDGRISLRGGGLAALCVALFASVVSLAGGGLGASPVLAQDASGPHARVWVKKLASGNVEFGVAVYSAPGANPTKATVNNRYFRHGSVNVGTWYNSEPFTLDTSTHSALVAVRARKLSSGNVEFALKVYGAEDSHWLPRARYFAHSSINDLDTRLSSPFYGLKPHAETCAGVSGNGLRMLYFFDPYTGAFVDAELGLFRDCEVLLAIKEELRGTPLVTPSTAFLTWTPASRNMYTAWGSSIRVATFAGKRRVWKLDLGRGVSARVVSASTLTGTIPKLLGKLTQLRHLDLGGHLLTGEIPSELGNLTELTHLDLHYNRLTGEIPSELGNLTKLTHLDLSKMNVGSRAQSDSGVPDGRGGRVFLANAGLTGSIPSELGNLTSLTNLFISNNKLTGSIPSELGNLTSLTKLFLSNNRLTGSIPSELGNLTDLDNLRLEHNRLTGSIPSELGNLTKVQVLALEHNRLTGSIPSELGDMTALTDLYLQENELIGGIPASLGSLPSLYRLFLWKNSLSGPIPSQLGNLATRGTGPLGDLFLRKSTLPPAPSDNPGLTGCVPAALRNTGRVWLGGLPWCSS